MNPTPLKNSTPLPIHVIGAGLAGSEAAYYLANCGHSVVLHEMRPKKMTEAHSTADFGELVCSNSLKSKAPGSAPSILKQEMSALGSLVLQAAAQSEVPAGDALAVNRELFSGWITAALRNHPRITVVNEEITSPYFEADTGLSPPPLSTSEQTRNENSASGRSRIPYTLLATGPLTSSGLCQWLQANTQSDSLYFYDAIAPIVDASTLDPEHYFLANRYGRGEQDAYLNCPLTEAEYTAFIDALIAAEKVQSKEFEKFFQGCQPIEAIVAGGRDSLRFGPMKPVGLVDPKTGKRPYAVLQLRPENVGKTAYNLVGFQTKLKYGEQKRVFGLIPALRNAEFVRLGSIHRNTYLCAPQVLAPNLSLRGHPTVFAAGQITGVEGYLESAACGLMAAIFMDQGLRGAPHLAPPINTGMGSLLHHVLASDPKHYQPANINFGLLDPIWFNIPEQPKTATPLGPKDWIRSQISLQAAVNFGHWLELAVPFASKTPSKGQKIQGSTHLVDSAPGASDSSRTTHPA